MAEKSIATINQSDAELAAEAATTNDLAKLAPEQRSQLYAAVCRSVGLNPMTAPFEYIVLNGKLRLYAKKDATDQLRKINGVSVTALDKEIIDGVLMVTAHAQDKSGRVDMDLGAVAIGNLKGDALANAYKKAITQAKRRVTLSISGLGFLDESEIDQIPAAAVRPVKVDHGTGEIIDTEPTPLKPAPVARQEAPERDEPHLKDAAHTKAMRRLHAVAKDRRIEHQSLSDWAFAQHEATSLADVSAENLHKLADALDEPSGKVAASFRAKFPGVDDATQPRLTDADEAVIANYERLGE